MNIQFISAGAGSGKTFTLTEKLAGLLADGNIQPQGVIATTFTRLAAGELRERVRSTLMQSGQSHLANQMGQAAINTVNGVCGELLKRFCFEAGLSPEQTVLDELEAGHLFGQATDQVMENNDQQIRKLNELALRLSIEDRGKLLWRGHVKSIADAARANNCEVSQLPQFAEQSISSLLAHFKPVTKRDLTAELQAAISTALQSIDITVDTTKGTQGYCAKLRTAANELSNGQFSWAKWIKLSKEKPTKKSELAAEPVQIIAADVEAHSGLQQDLNDYTHILFTLAGASLGAYQALKQQQGLVDFVDQELQLYHLLEHEQVKATLSDELQLLMVDEFQDTSPIQLALFLRLAALAKKVIWVGDIKQAIYGFRGSDPALMQAVLSKLQAEGNTPEVLSSSWRSRPALVNYCNAVFAPAFANTLPKEQVELTAQREELSVEPAVALWRLKGNNAVKMSAIAQGINDLVEQQYQLTDKVSGQLRDVRYGDIAVLCRSNARLASLAEACAEVGITVGYKRAGLLATPEGALALACLRRIADKSDSLAAAEIVLLVTGQSVETWLPQRLTHVASEQSNSQWGEQGEFVLPALQQLAKARAALNVLSPVEALLEALSKADVRAVVNRWGPTAQRSVERLANIDCLVALAQEYQDNCELRNVAGTTSGLVMGLYNLQNNEEDWQAVGSDENTVSLVTHHGAKGLEWPVVLAVDLEQPVKQRYWGMTVQGRPQGFDVAAPLAQRALQFWPYPFGKQKTGVLVDERIQASDYGQQAAFKTNEEEKRLLYVSLTRARDLLIFPLPEPPKKGDVGSLGTLDADWMLPEQETLQLPGGEVIPSVKKTCAAADTEDLVAASYTPHWLPQLATATDVLPRKFSPSSALPLSSAVVGKVVELGDRLKLDKVADMALLGSALHGVIAAAINSATPLPASRVSKLLKAFGVEHSVSVDDALSASQRFINYMQQNYPVLRCYVEHPVSVVNAQGQEANGYIDLLIETDAGWIIVDHKSSPQRRSEWQANALKFSGQLAVYRDAVTQVSDKPVLGCWVHFAVTGGVVEVVL